MEKLSQFKKEKAIMPDELLNFFIEARSNTYAAGMKSVDKPMIPNTGGCFVKGF
jgi:hypothetical protein